MDVIYRQDAIDVADAVWSVTGDKNVAKVWDQIKDLPSAQPDVPDTNVGDCISRKDAIDAIDRTDWYHINNKGELVHGANSKDDVPLYKAEDIYKVIEQLPSAQPEISLHESCADCPLYDKDRHSCPRFNKVIPETLREVMAERRQE